MHPSPSSSIHLHPAHFNLHPAHLSLHPALCNTLNVIITKMSNVIGQFPQIYTENSKLSVLPENWHSWYNGGADSESRLRISKFRPQNPFFGQVWAENSKLSVLPGNWHSWYIWGADSESKLRTSKFRPQNSFLGKFGLKSKSCSFGLKIGTHDILEELILLPDLVFQNSDPKILVWSNSVRKSKSCPFCLKIGTHGTLEELILHPDLVFWNSDPKILFWANLGQKIQSCLPENLHSSYILTGDHQGCSHSANVSRYIVR